MVQCITCGKRGGDEEIRLCAACKTVRYCSRECQKQHWKLHKAACKKRQEEDEQSKPKEKPAESRGERSAQREATAGATRIVTDKGSGPLETCLKCGLQAKEMKKCVRCLEATYCSKDCQRSHWRTHKDACKEIDVVTTDGFQRTEEREQAEARAKSKQERTKGKQGADVLGSLLNNLTVTLGWDEVKAKAQQLYPGRKIVNRFRDLPNDFILSPRSQQTVAVVKIRGVYPHFFRQGRCLEDAEGMTSFVLFHVEGSPEPYFRYEQLEEGNFLCYENAHMHFFADGTVGFRIDHARDIHIIVSPENEKE